MDLLPREKHEAIIIFGETWSYYRLRNKELLPREKPNTSIKANIKLGAIIAEETWTYYLGRNLDYYLGRNRMQLYQENPGAVILGKTWS